MKLLKTIENRELQIFSNPIIIVAMFLDKRFSDLLSSDDIETAKRVINQVQSRFESLTTDDVESTSNAAGANDGALVMDEEAAMVEQMLEQRTQKLREVARLDDTTADPLAVELRHFQAIERLRADMNIMDFWKKQKLAFPLLSSVALTILSIPVTEVDVERLFSHLTFTSPKETREEFDATTRGSNCFNHLS